MSTATCLSSQVSDRTKLHVYTAYIHSKYLHMCIDWWNASSSCWGILASWTKCSKRSTSLVLLRRSLGAAVVFDACPAELALTAIVTISHGSTYVQRLECGWFDVVPVVELPRIRSQLRNMQPRDMHVVCRGFEVRFLDLHAL